MKTSKLSQKVQIVMMKEVVAEGVLVNEKDAQFKVEKREYSCKDYKSN